MTKRRKKVPSKYAVDPVRSAQMALVRAKNTKPEIIVRRIIDDLGYKYKLHSLELAGRPDLVFPRRQKIIFVHGCFWHQHSKISCWRSRVPKTRQEFWIPKLRRNAARDRATIRVLRSAGWRVLVVWECETVVSKQALLKKRIHRFLTA